MWGMVFLACLLFLSDSLYGQSRPVVCTVTINSSDESEVFRSYLKEDFDFLELSGWGGGRDWFYRACREGVRCDILLISGHFAGTFFGESGYRLSLDELQRRACHSACDGILKRPKEVFLFGCNTTAGKEADGRTPARYTRDLIGSGVSPGMAEQLAAFRYSPLGEKTSERMRQVFPQARIYGFHSKAPLGHQIRWRLKNYFQSIPGGDYRTHFQNFSPGEENSFWKNAMEGQYIRSIRGSEGLENPVCILEGDAPLYKKLDWIHGVVADNNRIFSHVPIIDDYLQELERKFDSWEGMPVAELALLESIQFNQEAKERVTSVLHGRVGGMLRVQVQILNFSKRVGWYDDGFYQAHLKELLGGLFERNLNWERRDSVCSMGITLDLTPGELPREEWNSFTAFALGCVRPQNPAIHRRLSELLDSPRLAVRRAALWALGEIGTTDPRIQGRVVERLASPERSERSRASGALAKMNPLGSAGYASLVELFADSRYSGGMGWVLERVRPRESGHYAPLVALLNHPDERIRNVAFWVLGKHRPGGFEIERRLVALLRGKACTTAALLLKKIKPWDERTHSLLEGLKGENRSNMCANGMLLLRRKT